jgi:hypothetical protein
LTDGGADAGAIDELCSPSTIVAGDAS